MDPNLETSTSNHCEVLLSFLVQSPWTLGTRLKFISAASGLALYSCGTDNAEKTILLLRGADHTENTINTIANHLVHWHADCCLATAYDICSLRHSFHCSALERVYRAVAWQYIDKIHYNMEENAQISERKQQL
jgi:hypothetical protein